MMKPNQLAQLLLTTAFAFSSSSQAADEGKAYTLKTKHGDFAFIATDTKSAFQNATEIVAQKTKDETLQIGWRTRSFYADIAKVEDNKGQQVGHCAVTGNFTDNNPQWAVKMASLGTTQNPVSYKALCWDGTADEKMVAVQKPFTYEQK